MKRSLLFKSLLVLAVFVWSVISLVPTVRLARLPAEERARLDATTEGREQLDKLTQRAIKLGLDLQGGMYLVLDVDKSQLDPDAAEDAMDRVVEILRNRVDQFGVSEPVIQQQGDSRIVVQLPGLQDPERAKDLIGRTARLEFRLVREAGDVSNLLPKLDRVLVAEARGVPADTARTAPAAGTAQVAAAPADSAAALNPFTAPDQTAASGADTTGDELAALDDQQPLSSLLGPFMSNFGAIPVAERNRVRVTQLLASEAVKRAMPRDLEFLWGSEEFRAQGGGRAFLLYLVEKEVRLDGGEVQNALISPDPDTPTAMQVNLEFSRRGGLKFANITGANVGRKLGIVLDSVVNSAPVIRDKISGGRAVIQGNFTAESAHDLKVVLRAGALPADVRIEEERTVGPSLGRDSIRQGTNAAVWSCALIVLFMMVYYQLAGVVSAVGLVLTMGTLLAVLAQLHLTLTLPGIAGMVLTLGMAVDANVLIYERIREELRKDKSVRAAIDAGFHNAGRTIADANLTTLAAGIVLYIFGTGPIKGFAVTLNVGIVTSMFAALVFTRVVYDLWLKDRNPTRMSI